MGYFGLVIDDKVVYCIKILKFLDREIYLNYNLIIIVEDLGFGGLFFYVIKLFMLIVDDVNDNVLKFN